MDSRQEQIVKASTDMVTLVNLDRIKAATNGNEKLLILTKEKPTIEPVQPSSLLSRLKTFLPQLEESNRNLDKEAADIGVTVIRAEDEEEEAGSTSEESSSEEGETSSEEDSDTEETAEKELGQVKQPVFEKKIKLDVDLIRMDEAVDPSDVSVQAVEQLPKGFIEEALADATSGKKLIEELD